MPNDVKIKYFYESIHAACDFDKLTSIETHLILQVFVCKTEKSKAYTTLFRLCKVTTY